MSADEQGARLWTGGHHVLLPQLAPGLGVAGWQPSGNTMCVRPGVAVAASPRSQGRSWRAGKTLDTPQISALTINKAESHIVLQENWVRNPLLKLGVGHSLMRIEFGLICHLAAMLPFLFELQLLFCCMGLADYPMFSMCLSSDFKKKKGLMVCIQLCENT